MASNRRSIRRSHLTAEKERNLRREHERLHPDGLKRSGRPCEMCMVLDALKEQSRHIPRCSSSTPRGFRCAQSAGHTGPHRHPNDDDDPLIQSAYDGFIS